MAVATYDTTRARDEAAEPPAWRSRGEVWLDATLRSYAQLLFSRSRRVGVLVAAATFVRPGLGLLGLGSVLLATLLARMLGYSPERLHEGMYGYNALLVGIAGGALLAPTAPMLALLGLCIVLSVALQAAALSTLSDRSGLPALTLPFVAVVSLMWLCAPWLGLPVQTASAPVGAAPAWLPAGVASLLTSLGSLFFQPSVVSGALLLLALLVHSRIAFVLLVAGGATALSTIALLLPSAAPSLTQLVVVNGALASLALGAVFFVAGHAALLLGVLSASVSVVLSVGLLALLTPVGISPSILPFNLTVLLTLLALRQRQRDRSPKSVDFMPGTPEQNLRYFRMRLARFSALYGPRFALPFRGRWLCTQGVDRAPTHKGAFRYALDFEVAGEDGALHRGDGSRLEHYLCYKLPVLACADGTVAAIADGVPDNRVGEQNLRQNWGNAVVLAHGFGVFSLVAHLSPETIEVRLGQVVKKGQKLGLCGSSGRSPRPHLHFQLQSSAIIGSPPLPLELADVVTEQDDRLTLHPSYVPDEGETLRNLTPSEDVHGALGLAVGDSVQLFVDDDPVAETIVHEVDPLGRQMLSSKRYDTRLFFEQRDAMFTTLDCVGDRRSGLHVLALAVARLPLERRRHLSFTDYVPHRDLLARPLRPAFDLISPFLPERGARVTFALTASEHGVQSAGRAPENRAQPASIETFASFDASYRLQEAWTRIHGRRRRVRTAQHVSSPHAGRKEP